MKSSIDSSSPNGVRTLTQRLADAKRLKKQHVPILGNSFGKGEVMILFGPTAASKSLTAVTIGDGLSKGKQRILGRSNEAGKLKVLMYDFEMKDSQFLARYGGYEFDDNFLVIDAPPFNHQGKFNFRKFYSQIEVNSPDVVIVDNITYLESSSNVDGSVALRVMKMLQLLVKKTGTSFIVISHSNKSQSGLLKLSDVGGSSNIQNFADNVMGIGFSSEGRNFRYLIDLKQRVGTPSEELTVCQVGVRNGLLGLYYERKGEASLQIRSEKSTKGKSASGTSKLRDGVIHYHLAGLKNAEIARHLEMPTSTVSKYILEYKAHTERLSQP